MSITSRIGNQASRPRRSGRPLIEAYIERIAHDDEEAEKEIETFALEGLDSGESIEADEMYWEEKRRRLIARAAGEPDAG